MLSGWTESSRNVADIKFCFLEMNVVQHMADQLHSWVWSAASVELRDGCGDGNH